jgi:hypothetical protein
MAFMASRRLFTWWHWLAVPLLIGAFVIAFATNLYLGLVWSAFFAVWFWDSGETTCSRCSSYGTLGCGVQGKIIPWFWKKKTMASASPARIRLHFYFDIVLFLAGNAIYCLEPMWLPIMLTWTIGAWLISFGPKRFHGLLFRLKTEQPSAKTTLLASLPMVAVPEDHLASECQGRLK